MAITQTIVWAALPGGAGTDAAGRTAARLSAFVTPRLRGAQKLGDFPDFVDWPRRLLDGSLTFSVEVDGGVILPARLVGPAPDLDLWSSLFGPYTSVNSHEFDDYADRPIISYPVSQVLGYLKRVYQDLAIHSAEDLPPLVPAGEHERVSLLTALEPLIGMQERQVRGMTEAELSAMLEAQVEAARRTARLRRQLGQRGGGLIQPDPGYPPGDPRRGFSSAMLFHYRPAKANPVSMPEGEDETRTQLANEFDFHRMLASLHSYPELLRLLGLIIELEVDGQALPLSDEVNTHRLRLRPAWTPAGLPPHFQDYAPWTVYMYGTLDERSLFFPASRSGELVAGLWSPPPGTVDLVQVDVDGAALKTLNTAGTLARQILRPEDLPIDTPERDGVATLRTGGISLVIGGRASRLSARFTRSLDLNGLVESGQPAELYAEDLLHGYRLDVYDEAAGAWFSLHQRTGRFHPLQYAPGAFELAGEGFVQPAVAEPARDPNAPADPGGELFAHESLFTWDGWSLSAPRPGKSLSRSPRAPDPAEPGTEPEYTQNKAMTSLPLEVTFRPLQGSLPRLRFGRRYAFRVRVVDLAGNGPDLELANALLDHLPPANPGAFATENPLLYARFEPIPAPALVPRLEFTEGESLERLVVRSNFDTPAVDYAARHPAGALGDGHPGYQAENERHVVPPKTAQAAVETHGLLDAAFDANRQDLTDAQRQALREEAYNLSLRESGTLQPIHSAETLDLPYLPDPWSQGAVFYGLPGVTEGEPYFVEWEGASWYQAQPFRLRLVEGSGEPEWDPDARLLTVRLEKSAVAQVRVSSLFGGDLNASGLWQWLLEADAEGRIPGARLGELEGLVWRGRHWMFTPFRQLSLIHAVQQPLEAPHSYNFVTHRPRGETKLHLSDEVYLHSSSTAQLDLAASWMEAVDNQDYGLQLLPAQAHVLDLPASFDGLPGRLSDPDLLHGLNFDVENQILKFDTQTEELGLRLKDMLAAPNLSAQEQRRLEDLINLVARLKPHEFGDRKYRKVSYRYSATSRFREYFSPEITQNAQALVRSGEEIQVQVLSTAPPAAPRLLYVMPTYAWEQEQAEGGAQTSTRRGGGLRVYLDRPWFSSGEGELLGVVVSGRWPDRWAGVDQEMKPSTIYPYDTYWGDDPLWRLERIVLPQESDFLNAVEIGEKLHLVEWPEGSVTVYGHAVEYDPDRRLWFCDLALNTGGFYAPFVRLALVRFQPHSIVDGQERYNGSVHVSPVVTAEIVQTAPDRVLTVSRTPGGTLEIALTGPAPSGRRDPLSPHAEIGGANRVEARFEKRLAEIPDETLGWGPVGEPDAEPFMLDPAPMPGGMCLYRGEMEIPPEAEGQRLRLVVRELEPFTAFTPVQTVPGGPFAFAASGRVVYMDIIEL